MIYFIYFIPFSHFIIYFFFVALSYTLAALSLSPKTKPVRPEKDATVAKRLITNLIGGPVKPRTEEERKRDKEMERLRKG